MSTIRNALGFVLATAVFAGSTNAPAQKLDLEHQILESLTPASKPTRPTVRGVSSTPVDTSQAADRQFLDRLKSRTTRSLTTDERETIARIAKERPSIDIEINFDYNSAKILPVAEPLVTALGRALTSPELKGGTFVLAGHTDAKGSYSANQALSEKRADSVKRYLVDRFRIPSSSLVTLGYGKTKLKNESDPFASENRRVQIVNMEEKSVSER
jgi:outer membrane protein OmpA-like peptidoglycan-associated protein